MYLFSLAMDDVGISGVLQDFLSKLPNIHTGIFGQFVLISGEQPA
jgi:hypothetical protein